MGDPSENSDAPALLPLDSRVVSVLLENRQAFKDFLRSRLPGNAEAEDILQGSLVKALTRADSLRDPDRLVSWFYQILRHALTDYYRSRAAEARKYGDWAREFAEETPPEELEKDLCRCLAGLLPSLKPEYADVLRRADFESESLANIASNLGITENNLSVRLHRARQALKTSLTRSCGACAEHACLDCTCQSPGREKSRRRGVMPGPGLRL